MITIIKSSNKYIMLENGQRSTLFVAASSNIPNSTLLYEWSKDGLVMGTSPLIDLTNDEDGAQKSGMAGNWLVTVTDNTSDPVTIEFIVEEKAQWSAGVGSGDIIIPQRNAGTPIPYSPTSQINHTLGGFHLYEDLDDMLDVELNYLTLQYGQYAYTKFDKKYIKKDGSTYTIQTPNNFDKVYRFIRSDAKAARDELVTNLNTYNSDLSPLWWRFNARHYTQTSAFSPVIQASAVVVLDGNGYLPIADSNTNTGIIINEQGSGYPAQTNDMRYDFPDDGILSDYFPDTSVTGTTVLLYSDDAIELERINATIVNGKITRLQTTKILGPFTKTPTIVFLAGQFDASQATNRLALKWVLNRDWEEKVFLNCVPDNITTKIVNGQLSAIGGGGAESTWTDSTPALNIFSPTYNMSRLVGHNAIQILEDIIYPYQSVTIGLTAYNNNTPVNTLIENGQTVTITKVKAKINNYENLVDGTSVTLSGIYGVDTFTTEALGSKTKQQIIDASGLVEFTPSVINQPTVLNNTEGFSFTLSAVGREQGENYDGATIPHYVYGSEIINWAHKIYYYKSPNSDISGNVSIPVGAGVTQPTLTASGVYEFPKTTNPEYAWIIVPESFTINEIGLPEENIPFYQYADVTGNKFVTTNITITIGSNSYQYKGYRSYNKTASDVTVTIL